MACSLLIRKGTEVRIILPSGNFAVRFFELPIEDDFQEDLDVL